MDHKKVEKCWDKNASSWIEASSKGYDIWRDHFNTPAFLNMLPDICDFSGLEIGFGDGYNSQLIAKKCKHLVAIDISEQFFLHNKKNNVLQNLVFEKMDASDIKFPNEHFDFVVSIMCLMDVANLDQILKEIHRVLSPTGFLQFSIIHPCFDEHKGSWIKNEDEKRHGFHMKDYFTESHGDIHEWQHAASPETVEKFQVPRFSKPLTKWITSIINAGFIIDTILEPYADDEAIKLYPQLASTRIVAHSLIIRVRKNEIIYKESLQKIIEKLPGNVWWKNVNLVYLGCNDNVIQMLGLASRKEFIGKTDDNLFKKEIADNLKTADLHILKTGETITLEETITEKNGNKVVMLTNKSPLYDDKNNLIAIVGTSTNINERKKLEENLLAAKEAAEAASKAKTEFLENMRHDIRTPLTGITGFANIIKEETNDPKVREYVENLVASSNALLDFMNEILETIKLTSGEIPLYKYKFDLKKRINDVMQLNQAKAQEKKLDFELFYDPILPKFMIGDSKRIHRIILELVTNALNFTAAGCVTVSVELAKKIDKELIIKIIVSDTGIGIPAEKQQEIFMRFKKLHPSFEGMYKGAGLGLAVVKQFVDDLNGEIYVESELNKGSTFTCIFSLKEALLDETFGLESSHEEVHITHPQGEITQTIHSISAKDKTPNALSRVLLVEDLPIAAKGAMHVLVKLDCEVDIAIDGQAAISKASQNQYDLIFMDVGLSDISGLEATKRIRLNEWNQERPVPIIALTAHVESENKQLCMEAGMNAVLSKPLTKEVASDILNAFVPLRAAKKQIAALSQTAQEKQKELFNIVGEPVDYHQALQLTDSNEDFLNEILHTFTDSLSEEIINLTQAHDAKSWGKIRDIAHKIKGGTTYCGATRLREASSRLESYLKTDEHELADQLYEQMLNEIELFKQYIADNKKS